MKMSSDRHVKITAYLKVRCPKTTAPKTGPAPCCGKTPIGAFCSSCGAATQYPTVRVIVDAVSQYDIAESIGERLCYLHSNCEMPEGEFDIWHPNGPGAISTDKVGYQAITCEMIEEAKSRFEASYGHDLAVILKAYGQTAGDDAKICFGVLVWWM